MVEFGIVSWFFLSVGILSLFPAVGLFRQYKYTSIREYLIFSGGFFSSSLMAVGFLLIE
ncbi:MAG: hypothetical protein IH840_10150 [Candidatus Heimdallarchaeota archaeon]|nr:hypothetical protein [Candidatus Heimdallarchaeota archaeon]